eukprot:890335-Prorocentrum_minimum.AAC.1
MCSYIHPCQMYKLKDRHVLGASGLTLAEARGSGAAASALSWSFTSCRRQVASAVTRSLNDGCLSTNTENQPDISDTDAGRDAACSSQNLPQTGSRDGTQLHVHLAHTLTLKSAPLYR